MTRITASIGFDGAAAGRPVTATLAWGQNREYTPFKGISFGYLLEADLLARDTLALYSRAERVRKQILGLGFHPKGFGHPHVYADIDAFTLGGVQDLPIAMRGRVGIGADITVYRMGPDMAQFFAGSRSAHVFLRWRPRAASTAHVH